MSFGSHLKQHRINKGFSQEDLAKLAQVHSNHISRYERDQAAPSIDVVKRMAEALDVTIDLLVFGSNETNLNEKISDTELLSLFKKVQDLSDRQKDTVKDFLSAFVLKQDLKRTLV